SNNTLDKNYLHLARRHGLELQADTEVVSIRPIEGGGYQVEAKQRTRWFGRTRRVFRAKQVILAGGVLGTVELLLKLKRKRDGLPKLSDRLGCSVRTNSESLIGVCAPDMNDDLSKGVAIGSILQTDENSHLEMVRYGAGSGFFRLGMFPHVGGSSGSVVKLAKAVAVILRHPVQAFKAYTVADWAKQTMILLYMRTTEGTLRLRCKRSVWSAFRYEMSSTLEDGEKPTASIPEATALAKELAELSGGWPASLITEVATNVPTTAHILGGCCMGSNATNGVIDHRHRVFGYEGLFVIDGSAVSANPGVNPSLTILALAERAMSFIPPKPASP
ncbi:MAG TPA: GMC oxidoreductase, partial [Polyangiaceae bacterium]|nr:GMC oxidoreductase [Polyangiaceae bacterium]